MQTNGSVGSSSQVYSDPMRWWLSVVVLVVGCTGSITDGSGRDSGPGGSMDAGDAPPGTDAGDVQPGTDAGPGMMGFDAGSCAGGLVDGFSTTPVSGLGGGAVHAAATATGLVVVTWGGGGVTVTELGLDGSAGASHAVDGNRAWGIARADDGATGVLVDRASDELWAVVLEPDGSTRFEQRLLGGVSHDVTENEWFGTGIRAGRMSWDGAQWVTYHTVQRLWDDGVAHYGDTLRFLDATTGAQGGGGWSWGCSHSMAVGLAENASGTGAVCVSDCFPGKGVYFSHRTELFEDPSGDCRGRIDTQLGGIAPTGGGFLIAFATPHTRSGADVALVHAGDDRSVGEPIWLTDDAAADSDVCIAEFDGGALVGWSAGGVDRLAHVDASGAVVEGPVDAPGAGLSGASDFVALPGGGVAWVSVGGGSATLAQVYPCEER